MHPWFPTLLLLVSGCAPPDEAQVQLADAGSDVWGQPGQRVQLDGTDAQGERLLWRFAALPPGSDLTQHDLEQAHTPWPQFTGDVEGLYTLELLACDDLGCDTDRALVGLGEHHRPALATATPTLGGLRPGLGGDNLPPEAVGFSARALSAGGAVHLNGADSSDPDGDSLRFRWSFAQRPAGSTLTNTDIEDRRSALASFTPDVSGTYVLTLWVSDGYASDSTTLPPLVVVGQGWDDWDPWF